MNRHRSEESGSSVQIAPEELKELLARLEPSQTGDASPVYASAHDVAEATGVSPERVEETLREVRGEIRGRNQRSQKKKAIQLGMGALAGLAGLAIILNLPLLGHAPVFTNDPANVAITDLGGHGHSIQVNVYVDYHPRTLWRLLLGPQFEPNGVPRFTDALGEHDVFESRPGQGGMGVTWGQLYRTGFGSYHVMYQLQSEWKGSPVTQISQELKADGTSSTIRVNLAR